MRRIGVMTVALAILAAACGEGDTPGDGGSARPSSTATIAILEPEGGATVPGPEVEVRIALEGGEIVEESSRDLTPTEGHVHVKVDGRTLTQTYGLTQTITVEPGQHVLEVEFAAKDHGSFNPVVSDAITFTVEGEAEPGDAATPDAGAESDDAATPGAGETGS